MTVPAGLVLVLVLVMIVGVVLAVVWQARVRATSPPRNDAPLDPMAHDRGRFGGEPRN